MDKSKKFCYLAPTQVKFREKTEDSYYSEAWGIAFNRHIICLCCGQVIPLTDDIEILREEESWIDLDQSIDDAATYYD